MSNYSSVYEIAEKYQNMSREVPYPTREEGKPVRERYASVPAFSAALNEYEIRFHTFIEQKKEYHQAQEQITQGFKRDLLEYLEVSNHPKAETLWNLAWDHGHGSGYNDVAGYAEDFSELMK